MMHITADYSIKNSLRLLLLFRVMIRGYFWNNLLLLKPLTSEIEKL
jgi:hypothetical protein